MEAAGGLGNCDIGPRAAAAARGGIRGAFEMKNLESPLDLFAVMLGLGRSPEEKLLPMTFSLLK